jgi:hypothetical protein
MKARPQLADEGISHHLPGSQSPPHDHHKAYGRDAGQRDDDEVTGRGHIALNEGHGR